MNRNRLRFEVSARGGECGAEHDRDWNAALNIARLGCETPSLKGLGSLAF